MKEVTGTTLGAFEVGELIGEGATGAVYAGVQPSTQRRVAVKVLASDPGHFDADVRTVSTLQHPGIVEVLAFGKLDDGRPFEVMELLDGRSFRALLRDHGALAPDVVGWLLEE